MSDRPTFSGLATVLVAVDESDFGAGAVRVATALAIAEEALLVVLAVLTGDPNAGVMGRDTRAADEHRRWVAVNRIAADAEKAGATVRALVRHAAHPAEAIVAAAKDIHADMIVLGRRAKRGLASAIRGDITARVIGGADCPVLVVPRQADIWRQRILLATDGSPASALAARIAGTCAAGHRIPVTVLSVESPRHSAERQAEASRIATEAAAMLVARTVDAAGRVDRGAPAERIVAAAAETGADLIVMGSEGRSGLGRVMLGSNSQTVIAKATCPVLVTTTHMLDHPKPEMSPETLSALASPGEPERRTFLVIADDDAETDAALDYACRRAYATGGRVMVLRIAEPAEDERQARRVLDRLADQVTMILGETPVTFLRRGPGSRAILDLVAAEPSISVIVLTAGAASDERDALIVDLITRHAAELPVPVMIVPRHGPGARP
jgi:nucleotide-binding universal stress UspA family protein